MSKKNEITKAIDIISFESLDYEELNVKKTSINIIGLSSISSLIDILNSNNIDYEEIKFKKDSAVIYFNNKYDIEKKKRVNQREKVTSEDKQEEKVLDSVNKKNVVSEKLTEKEAEKYVKYLAWILLIFLFIFSIFNVFIPFYNQIILGNVNQNSDYHENHNDFNSSADLASVETLDELDQVVNEEMNLDDFNSCGDFFGEISKDIVIHIEDGLYSLKEEKVRSTINPGPSFEGVCFEINSGDDCCLGHLDQFED
ncbi:MAG: hypothetical protein ACOCP4_00055 [Candidatus Woesearchaeota archaeon]